jgi:undecaprenyl-diphosphatase
VDNGLSDFVKKRLHPAERYGLRLTLFALALLLVAIPFAYLLGQVTSRGPLVDEDFEIARSIHDLVIESGFLESLSRVFSFLGSPLWFWIIIPLAAAFFLFRREAKVSLYLVTTNLLGGVINSIVKFLVDRPRPVLEDPIAIAAGKSFPSGHAMGSTIAYGSLLLAFMPLIPRRWRTAAIVAYILLVIAISASRLGLGVHFLSDVLAGIVLGLAWLLISTATFHLWRRERGEQDPDVDLVEGVEPEIAREDTA